MRGDFVGRILAGQTTSEPRAKHGRFRAEPEPLEARLLLSTGPIDLKPAHAPAQVERYSNTARALDDDPGEAARAFVRTNQFAVRLFYNRMLDREPTADEKAARLAELNGGKSALRVATELLLSREFHARHKGARAFVNALYQEVLERAPRRGAVGFFAQELHDGDMSRSELAATFLKAESSLIHEIHDPGPLLGGTLGGSINSVNVVPGASTGTAGTTAYVGIIYNNNDLATRTITISVNGAGTYTLNQTQSWGVTNNTGKTWTGFKLVLVKSQSTAGASLFSTSDASGMLPKVTTTNTSTTTTATFSGGKVPPSFSNFFQPLTTIITAAAAGTIVIQETPIV